MLEFLALFLGGFAGVFTLAYAARRQTVELPAARPIGFLAAQ